MEAKSVPYPAGYGGWRLAGLAGTLWRTLVTLRGARIAEGR